MAKRDDIELWSLDECHFQQHGSRCRMWVPPEVRDPVLLHAPTRKSTACFGAVNLTTGQLVHMTAQVFNAETCAAFLKQLLRHRRRRQRMVVVLDNARYHHARLLAPWLHTHRHGLTLFFLPPYSPQLAPIERVWKLTRRLAMHNRYFATLDEVVEAVQGCFRPWEKPNETLHRLCCII
jgi:transposase